MSTYGGSSACRQPACGHPSSLCVLCRQVRAGQGSRCAHQLAVASVVHNGVHAWAPASQATLRSHIHSCCLPRPSHPAWRQVSPEEVIIGHWGPIQYTTFAQAARGLHTARALRLGLILVGAQPARQVLHLRATMDGFRIVPASNECMHAQRCINRQCACRCMRHAVCKFMNKAACMHKPSIMGASFMMHLACMHACKPLYHTLCATVCTKPKKRS